MSLPGEEEDQNRCGTFQKEAHGISGEGERLGATPTVNFTAYLLDLFLKFGCNCDNYFLGTHNLLGSKPDGNTKPNLLKRLEVLNVIVLQ